MSGGIQGAELALDNLLGNVFTFMPWVFMFAAFMWLVTHVLSPLMADVVKARAKERTSKTDTLAKAEQRRALATKIALDCSDFDDWLETHILMLRIDCASDPESKVLSDMLVELVSAKAEISDIIVRLHRGGTINLSGHDEQYVSEKWSMLAQKIKELPGSNAA